MAKELTHYDAVIADLKARRDEYDAMIKTLEQMKAGGTPLTASSANVVPRSAAAGAPEIPHDAFFHMTVQDAAQKYLAIVKRTTSHPDLCDALLD